MSEVKLTKQQITDLGLKEFKYASDNTCLPSKPNYKRVEELLMNIYEEVISNDR